VERTSGVLSELGARAPYWRTRATNGFVYPTSGWDGDWTYHFRLGEYKHIEWCEITPKEGRESIDCSQILEACKRIGLEHETIGNVIRVVGYRRI
jgi:hypothetical protein